MKDYAGLEGREKLINTLTGKYSSKTAATVTYVQGSCGQGKTYVINRIIDKISETKVDISIFTICEDKLVKLNEHSKSKKINSISLSGGLAGFSVGLGIDWENTTSQYEKVRGLLASVLKKDILICIDDIERKSSEVRLLIFQILNSIQRLETEYNKKIFILISDTQDSYRESVYKYNVTIEIIDLPVYEKKDVKNFLKMGQKLLNVNTDNIYDLCQGNLNLVDFFYEELLDQNNCYISTLSTIVNRRLSIIKEQGIKKDLDGKDMEDIIFSASLAIKKFSVKFLENIVKKDTLEIACGLEIACEESLLEKDFSRYYNFISEDIQKYIAELTAEKRDDLFIAYYNYYTQYEQDEYYLRAYYVYKYQKQLSNLSISLFLLAYSFAQKLFDELKIKRIENIFNLSNNESAQICLKRIKKFYDDIFNGADIDTVKKDYAEIQSDYLDLSVKAQIVCEYFDYLYRKTAMNTVAYNNILDCCIGYAMHELYIDTSEIDGLIRADEALLRLKIIYDIAPCVLDQRNDYKKFQELYCMSKELSSHKCNSRQKSIGEYIENVFNRKAFLFVNQSSCDVYYEKAKNYFRKHEIWIEYYVTLICQAGTDIVIQEFEQAISLCQKAEKECKERNIQLPQCEKLYNNEIIAEFLFMEQQTKTISKLVNAAKKALNKLKKLITKEANATQCVIYTNICSLCLYIDDKEQYSKYKKRLEKLYGCDDIADVCDENIDDFYRYYFAWFELYRAINLEDWEKAEEIITLLDGFIPALFQKQEIFWERKNGAAKEIIMKRQKVSAYDFCHNLVQTKRIEQTLSKFFYRGLMVSDLQYTSYF